MAPPSLYLRTLEGRAPLEAMTSLALWPLLVAGSRGDGHSVLVLPGLLASDDSTEMLRAYLRQRGFVAVRWGQGNILGPRLGVVEGCLQLLRELLRQPPRVPTSSIYSRSDGVFAWQSSVLPPQPQVENIEVRASHIGMGMHPAVRHAVADRLAQPEGQWASFQRHGLRRWIYGETRRQR